MKKLMFDKGKKMEGSMEEGYISYEYFYYGSEYINRIDNTPGTMIWDDKRDEDKREGELLQTNGHYYTLKKLRRKYSFVAKFKRKSLIFQF
jgi:hypothetical protein